MRVASRVGRVCCCTGVLEFVSLGSKTRKTNLPAGIEKGPARILPGHHHTAAAGHSRCSDLGCSIR